MTWVLGANTTIRAQIIGDTRVTWDGRPSWSADIQKIHLINPYTIAGFAGSVEGGFKAIELLKDTLGHLQEPSDLRGDVLRPARVLRKEIARLPTEFTRNVHLVIASLASREAIPGFRRTHLCRMLPPHFNPEIAAAGVFSIGTGSKVYLESAERHIQLQNHDRTTSDYRFLLSMRTEIDGRPRHDVGRVLLVGTVDSLAKASIRSWHAGPFPHLFDNFPEFDKYCEGNGMSASAASA